MKPSDNPSISQKNTNMQIDIKLTPAQTQSVVDQDLLAEAEIVSAAQFTTTPNQFDFFCGIRRHQ